MHERSCTWKILSCIDNLACTALLSCIVSISFAIFVVFIEIVAAAPAGYAIGPISSNDVKITMARPYRRSRDLGLPMHKRDGDVTSGKSSKSRSLGKKRQVAALVFRISEQGRLEILLITSLGTGRPVIPKGWPMKGLRDYAAAAKEAYEEAGIVGKIGHKSIGRYEYLKRMASTFEVVSVDVYPLRAARQRKAWPERGRRELGWFTLEDAASMVSEPALSMLFRQFASLALP